MRVVVTGCQGQVAQSLVERGVATGHEVVALGRPQLDLAANGSQIFQQIASTNADIIVSAAAYTAVDKAEDEPDKAFLINATGAGAVAHAAQQLEIPIIHLSTDYVFDGSKATPYSESDDASPATIYGASKLAAERDILGLYENSAVLRTAWVYSAFGNNFVKTILRLGRVRDQVHVVADQVGNPTSALDIADGLLAIALNLLGSNDPTYRGLFHMAGAGAASWADLAELVFEVSRAKGGPFAAVTRIATEDYPTRAKRPANSQLDCSKLERAHGVRLPDWRSSTPHIVSLLLAQQEYGGRFE